MPQEHTAAAAGAARMSAYHHSGNGAIAQLLPDMANKRRKEAPPKLARAVIRAVPHGMLHQPHVEQSPWCISLNMITSCHHLVMTTAT